MPSCMTSSCSACCAGQKRCRSTTPPLLNTQLLLHPPGAEPAALGLQVLEVHSMTLPDNSKEAAFVPPNEPKPADWARISAEPKSVV